MRRCDVLILGGGPAGCATALSLRSHAPELSVSLVEPSAYERPRIGEVLPSLARTLLHHLRLLDAFNREQFRPAHSTAAAWGEAACRENHFIYSASGAGWHLDRARFDGFLARSAASRGVELLTNTRAALIEKEKGGWHLLLSDGTEMAARFVVDASGRRAAFARKIGARQKSFDRLSGYARFFTLGDNPTPGTLVEAFSEGWWYTALAGGRRVVACMTDTDIARRLSLRDKDRWFDLLSQTRWIAGSVGSGEPDGQAMICAANSTMLDTVGSSDWLAVGDAASAFDPLSSQGIVKSLRSGIFASYAIADLLEKSDAAGLARYKRFVQIEFAGYQIAHADYCGRERRWPREPFWRRRHSGRTQDDANETRGCLKSANWAAPELPVA